MQLTRNYQPNPEKRQALQTALIITLAGNIILAVGKGVAAYYSGSIALYADAANSVSDVIYSIAVAIGLYISLKPPDLTHPQGHSRFEPLVGLVVASTMGIAGYEALRSSIARFIAGGSARKIAQKTNSPSLRATSKDHLSDVLTSVAAFVGIFGSNFLHPLLDPAAGLLVSLWIFKSAYEAGRENLRYLTGAGADAELRQKILDTAAKVEGVQNVHHMMSDYVGPKLVVDLHINLPGDLSLDEVHTVEDQVIDALEALDDVDRVYVHVEPSGHR